LSVKEQDKLYSGGCLKQVLTQYKGKGGGQYQCRSLLIIYFSINIVVFVFRFYIESIGCLRDNSTVEMFYQQAQQAIYSVSTLDLADNPKYKYV